MNFDQVRARVRAKTEVDRAVTGRSVTHAGGHVIVLGPDGFADDFDASANSVAIALVAAKRNIEPVSGILGAVHPKLGVLTQRGYDDVDFAVAFEVPKSAAAMTRSGTGIESSFVDQFSPFAA